MDTDKTETAAMRTVIDAAYDTLKDGLEPHVLPISRGNDRQSALLLAPKGMQVIDAKPFLDKYLPAPERRQGTANFTELQSFVDYLTRFKSAPSVVFAVDNADAPKLVAVFNHHPAGAEETQAGFGDHRAIYHFPLSLN
jgi:hypothetical protein